MTRRLPRPILVFWLARLKALGGKMALLVTIVTGGPAYVPIFPTCWLVAATIISSQGLGCVDPSGRDGALRPGAAGAAIATLSIMPTLLMVPARSLQDLSSLETMRRHGSCLLGAERKGASILDVVLGRFQGGAVASGAASIHLTDPRRKVQGGLGLSCDSLLDSLVPGVLLTTLLFGLGTDGGP